MGEDRKNREALIIAVCVVFVLVATLLQLLEVAPVEIEALHAAGLPDQRVVIVEAKLRPARFYQAPATTLATVYHPAVPDGVTEARYQPLDQTVLWRDDFSPGTLDQRVDDDTGVCVLPSVVGIDGQTIGHGITVANTVSVWWAGGERHAMTVSAVSGTAVTVDGGSGDNLPTLGTRVDVGIDPTATVGNVIFAGDVEKYPGRPDRIRFFEAAASARLNEQYYKP